MAEQVEVLYQMRQDTPENWASVNPVLRAGEQGVSITGDGAIRYKIGNGVDSWNDLEYADDEGGGAGAIADSDIAALIADPLTETRDALGVVIVDVSSVVVQAETDSDVSPHLVYLNVRSQG